MSYHTYNPPISLEEFYEKYPKKEGMFSVLWRSCSLISKKGVEEDWGWVVNFCRPELRSRDDCLEFIKELEAVMEATTDNEWVKR